MADQWLAVGQIVAPQGIKGEVRVYPDSDFPERFETPGERWITYPNSQEFTSIQLLQGRYVANKRLYVVKFAGITHREQAELLRGCTLWVPESDRPQLAEGEFYLLDLVGLDVVLQATQVVIGTVISLVPAGNDLLEVQLTEPEGKTVLIPFVQEIVPQVNVEQGYLEISPPLGLL